MPIHQVASDQLAQIILSLVLLVPAGTRNLFMEEVAEMVRDEEFAEQQAAGAAELRARADEEASARKKDEEEHEEEDEEQEGEQSLQADGSDIAQRRKKMPRKGPAP